MSTACIVLHNSWVDQALNFLSAPSTTTLNIRLTIFNQLTIMLKQYVKEMFHTIRMHQQRSDSVTLRDMEEKKELPYSFVSLSIIS